MHLSYVFIPKFALYMFRMDTPFIIRSSHITVYAAVCTHHAGTGGNGKAEQLVTVSMMCTNSCIYSDDEQ